MISAEESCIFYESSLSKSSASLRTSNPRPKETYSVFGEGSCGEPLLAQHLLIDFTPNEDVDTDFIQRKICSFWKFIHNTPEIKNLMVVPAGNTYTKLASTTDYTPNKMSVTTSDKTADGGRSAVSMLEFVEEKGLIDRAFEPKMPKSHCSLASREYKKLEPVQYKTPKKRTDSKPCSCTSVCKPCPGLIDTKMPLDSPTKRLCKQLQEWDAKHSKSMEPPGHAPMLRHAVMQRPVYQ